MINTRIEKDSMGELKVPKSALYGAQTQRAINNFPVSGLCMPETFIRALLKAKSAAAKANAQLDQIPVKMAEAICQAADALLAKDAAELMENFPVDVFQTGSGTSSNMNANEVLANVATKIYGDSVGANDHINCGQSSNDIIPSTIHISSAIEIKEQLLPALKHFVETAREKAADVGKYVKTGRTHLMDAMPIRMSQSIESWASQIENAIYMFELWLPNLQTLAQGGTAVGTGINAHPDFAHKFCEELNNITGMHFKPATNFFSHISSQDIAVSTSGQLKTVGVAIMKIANDLRWMNSGPLAGLGEIELEALQPGSSIMPGKVNPVIPEAATMVSAQVIGNDATITLGGQAGNFELNVMLPVIAKNLLESIKLLSNICILLADKAVATFTVKQDKLNEAVSRNLILVTALNPIIGYLKAAEIAKLAYKEGRPVIDVAAENTDLSVEELEKILDPRKLTFGGI